MLKYIVFPKRLTQIDCVTQCTPQLFPSLKSEKTHRNFYQSYWWIEFRWEFDMTLAVSLVCICRNSNSQNVIVATVTYDAFFTTEHQCWNVFQKRKLFLIYKSSLIYIIYHGIGLRHTNKQINMTIKLCPIHKMNLIWVWFHHSLLHKLNCSLQCLIKNKINKRTRGHRTYDNIE